MHPYWFFNVCSADTLFGVRVCLVTLSYFTHGLQVFGFSVQDKLVMSVNVSPRGLKKPGI